MCGVLPSFVELAGGAIGENAPDVLFHAWPEIGATEKSVDLDIVEVKHPFVRVSNQQVNTRRGHNNSGGLIGRGGDSQFLTLRSCLHFLQELRKFRVCNLGANPRFAASSKSS